MRVVLFASILFSLTGRSADIDAESLFRKYKEIKGDIITHEEEKRKVLADLFEVTVGMKKINKRREILMGRKHEVESRIEKTSEALEQIRSDLDDQREKLRSRLRGLYKFNGQGAMRLIFSSQTPSDLDRNLKILQILADKNYVLIRSYEKNVKAYSRQTEKLKIQKKHLLAIELQLKAHEEELLAQKKEKNRIVEGINRETLSQLVSLEKIRNQSSKVNQAQVDPSLKIGQSFFEVKGKLEMPVKGSIIQGFGLLEDRKYGIKLRSKGVFIEAETGSDVKSVFNGEVMFSDVIPGLGQTLILSHGDRYYTVYGNNSNLAVQKGQKVAMGDVVAHAGAPWRQNRSGVYFEIRHFSDFVDPEEWFEKTSNAAVGGTIGVERNL